MADDKQVDFVDGETPVTAAWLDRMQEVEQGLAWNINLSTSGTSIVVPAGPGENIAAIIIKGKMRYNTSLVSFNFTGQSGGYYNVYAVTTATDSDHSWTLAISANTDSSPSGYTYYRKIATVQWSGASFGAEPIVLSLPISKHASNHSRFGSDPLPVSSVPQAYIDAVDAVTISQPRLMYQWRSGINLTSAWLGITSGIGNMIVRPIIQIPVGMYMQLRVTTDSLDASGDGGTALHFRLVDINTQSIIYVPDTGASDGRYRYTDWGTATFAGNGSEAAPGMLVQLRSEGASISIGAFQLWSKLVRV